MNIFVIRHGETDWNKQFRLQGRTNIPLNDDGRAQARKTAEGLKEMGITFDAVYTSPLIRAVETAEILSGFPSDKIKKDDRIIELSFGKAEGTTPSERKGIAELDSFNAFFDSPENYVAKSDAEPLSHVLSRTADFWESEIKAHEGEYRNVLVSTHGGTLQSLLLHVDGRSLSQYWDVKIPNCTVNLVTLKDGVFHVEYTAKTFYKGGFSGGADFFVK